MSEEMTSEVTKKMKILKTCYLYSTFFVLDYCVVMGKARDISPGKVAVVKCLIQENHYTQHEIAKKAKISQASGLALSVIGPCLLDLQYMVQTDTSHISLTYTARSGGYFVGAILGGTLLSVFKYKQALLSICNLTVTVTMLGVPWSSNVQSLLGIIFIMGFTLGTLETGGNVICLQLWGKDSDPVLHGLYFTYSLGCFVAPLIAAPFLHRREELMSTNYNVTNSFDDFFLNSTSNISKDSANNLGVLQRNRGVIYPFSIIGIFAFLVTILNLVICILSPTEKEVSEGTKAEKSKRSNLFMFFITPITFLSFMVTAGTELGFGQALTAYAAKGKLHVATRIGSYMTSVFWVSCTFGRLVAVYLAMKMKNLSILSSNICIIGLSAIILLFFMPNEWALWLASVVFGIGISSSHAATVGYIGSHIYIGNKLSGVIMAGCSAGGMSFPSIITYFSDTIPNMFAFVTTGGCVLMFILTITLYCMFEKVNRCKKNISKELCAVNYFPEKNNFNELHI